MNTEPLARGAVASPAATAPARTQSLTLMLLCHLDIFDLGKLSLWSLSKLYHEPSFPWQLPCWWGGVCPLGLVSFHFQKPFSLDLVSSLLQNLPAACPTELSLFHPVLQDLLLFRWWSQPCLEKRWSLQWESSVYSPLRPQGAGKKL